MTNDGPIEIRPFTLDVVNSNEGDFRAIPIPADAAEEVAPKAFAAPASVTSFEGAPVQDDPTDEDLQAILNEQQSGELPTEPVTPESVTTSTSPTSPLPPPVPPASAEKAKK